MDRACSRSTNGTEEDCIKVIGGKARRKETTRKMERIIFKWILLK
jgi:hypothetical protein